MGWTGNISARHTSLAGFWPGGARTCVRRRPGRAYGRVCPGGALEAGGAVTGIAPRFFDEPGILRKDCAEFIFTETMSERKQLMAGRADAFIALPGGIGTFEEFFETLTLKQLGRHCKPMVLLNTRGYYEPMTALLARSAAEGFMSHGCMALFSLCDTPTQALELVKAPSGPRGSIRRLSDYSK